jgi:hypothetical protein
VNPLIGKKRKLSSAYHPQTERLTERNNHTLEVLLRAYVQSDQTDWDEHLACAEFVINDTWQGSVKITFFLLVDGMHPFTPPVSASLHRLVPSAHGFYERNRRGIWESQAGTAGR